ncbi:Shikimate dehydrogenase [Rhodothermus marinus SG0.5JP17-172]|uniref:shikimate dehydrogenase n=1 Tax=Rhodothermus marinus TaxID=29549 RepID=UPI000223D2FE|nr:shikimate dehydrogenase [Rhodothermus marinus]AEN72093.1 Shikimate dehydrogenase [Rhodothermus marinus SG0.5JP17-172]
MAPGTDVSIRATTRPVALLGDPVAHSFSPLIHNTGFRTQGLDYVYLACRVPKDALPEAIAGLRALGFAGANVTIPHKEAVRPLLDRCTPRAEAIGAVNTIVCRADGSGTVALIGDNTDVEGFLEPLQPLADRLTGAEMVVLGAGGAARAVVYALLTEFRPTRLTIVARTPARGEALAADFATYDTHGALQVAAPDQAAPAIRSARLIVNATPVGMHPHVAASPWPHAEDFGPEQIVYDLVYNPVRTRLLREAATRGATPIDGLTMLIGQAAAAYRQWTGHELPREAVQAALKPLFQD